jgi:ankyrin repeat protein
LETVQVLLEQGADILDETWNGITAIHVTIVMGHFEILEHMFSVQLSSNRSSTPSELNMCDTLPNFSASFIRSERVAYILDLLAMILDSDGRETAFGKANTLGETILHRAAAVDNIHAAKWAIRWNAEIVHRSDKKGRTLLFYAAAAGSFAVYRMLIDNGAAIDATDDLSRTPLHAACRGGHHQLVHLLFLSQHLTMQPIQHAPAVAFNAWHFASLSGRPEILRDLRPYLSMSELSSMRSSAKAPDDVLSPLHIASLNGSLECVKILCEAGFSLKAESKYCILSEADDMGERIRIPVADVPGTAEDLALRGDYHAVAKYLRSRRKHG